MSTRTRFAAAIGPVASALLISLTTVGAPRAASPQMVQSAPPADEGIPVMSDEVRRACGVCHPADAQGRMSRISYRRATPENWELTIKRMAALNGAPVTPEQARKVLKYLADHHGLAPEEAAPVMFDAERRVQGMSFTYEGDKQTHDLCNACHSVGRVLSERRTPEEWDLLIAMHRGVYPGIDGGSGSFRRGAGAPGVKAPVDLAVEHLARAFPLMSAEWREWSATRAPVRLDGRWSLAGYQPGRGPVFGEVVVEAVPGEPDTFTTTTTFTYAKTGETVTRDGRAIVYTGFQWRGRSSGPSAEADEWREVAAISRDQQEMSGRWFTGFYGEVGLDVTLRRVGAGPVVAGIDVPSLRAGATAQTVRIYGANLPQSPATDDIAFGAGVTVTGIVEASPTVLTVTVDVADDARAGPRDVIVAGAHRPSALVVYDRIDGVRVTPQAGLARVGGIVHPKMLQQFEAVAFHSGPDGKAGTDDDLLLGAVEANWSLEEYSATFLEDDLEYVGELRPDGLFVPNVDGINPERSGGRNNIGDVWVVAEYAPPGESKTLRGRAHLLVAPPLYMNWASTEVGQ